jgi:DNA-binding GntR family transcriptional regulator
VEAKSSGRTGAAVPYLTKSEATYVELRRRIVDGDLAPMEHLNQEELARALGVSTTPLREALRRLESEGLVITTAHRDVVVAPLDLAALPDLYDTKVELECYAVRLAADRHTPADERAMTAALGTLLADDATDDDIWQANRAVHESMFRASHNAIAVELLETVWDRFERYRRFLRDVILDPAVEGEHEEIVAAILARDGQRASDLMRTHSAHGRRAIEHLETDDG